MRIEIARLHKLLGATMIYVTHDQVEAMTLADKIVVLQGGVVEQVGRPLDLYDDPDNIFVAGFIGSPKMNFLAATVTASSAGTTTIAVEGNAAQSLTLTGLTTQTATGTAVTIGIRPEHIDFSGQTGMRLPIRCDVTEAMGEVTFVHGRTTMDTHLVVEARGERLTDDVQNATIGINAAKVLMFGQNGKRIR
jgi:lactose/L-arabinose transport system ATP-binding protein